MNVEVPEDYSYVNAEAFYKALVDENIETSDFDLSLADWSQKCQINAENVHDTNYLYTKDFSDKVNFDKKIRTTDAMYVSFHKDTALLQDELQDLQDVKALVDSWGVEEYTLNSDGTLK